MFAVVYQYQRVPPMRRQMAAPLVSMVFTEPPRGAFDQPDDGRRNRAPSPPPSAAWRRSRLRGASAHSEIIADHDHRAAIDLARPNTQFAGVRFLSSPCSSYSALPEIAPISWKLVEVDQAFDALANGEPTWSRCRLTLSNASHLARERFAAAEVVELRSSHSSPPC